MSIDQISSPKGVGPHATKSRGAITDAATDEELNRAGGTAEGFVLVLESSSPFSCFLKRPEVIRRGGLT